MGWDPFDEIKDAYDSIEDSVKGAFSDLDSKLNISEDRTTWLGAATMGVYGAGMGYFHDQASDSRKSAQDAANRARSANLAMNRTVNMRSYFSMLNSTQQNASDLMAIAANGGFMNSSAIKQSVSSAEAQIYSAGAFYNNMDRLGQQAASAQVDMQSAQNRMNKYNSFFQTGVNIGTQLLTMGLMNGGLSFSGGGAATPSPAPFNFMNPMA